MSVHTHSRGLLVMKFGGTSVGDVTAVQHVLNIVREARTAWPAMVVVASALAGSLRRFSLKPIKCSR